jgi:hypothetical protein
VAGSVGRPGPGRPRGALGTAPSVCVGGGNSGSLSLAAARAAGAGRLVALDPPKARPSEPACQAVASPAARPPARPLPGSRAPAGQAGRWPGALCGLVSVPRHGDHGLNPAASLAKSRIRPPSRVCACSAIANMSAAAAANTLFAIAYSWISDGSTGGVHRCRCDGGCRDLRAPRRCGRCRGPAVCGQAGRTWAYLVVFDMSAVCPVNLLNGLRTARSKLDDP